MQVARPRAGDHYLRQKPLDIENRPEQFTQFGAQNRFAYEVSHGVEPRLDFRLVERRTQQSLAHEPAAHAGSRLVEDGDERCAAIVAGRGEDRFEQFQIPHRNGVEHHVLRTVEMARRIEVIERGALCVAKVMEHRSGGGNGTRAAGESAAIERMQAEVFAQNAVCVVGGEDPVFKFGGHPAPLVRLRKQRVLGGDQDFARADAFE